jgi:hypothetical protein
LKRERNGLLIPGWHWKASVHGRWQLDGQDTSTISSYVCVCVCGPMFFCWRFKLQPMEIYVDDEAKLTLHGLVQVRFL